MMSDDTGPNPAPPDDWPTDSLETAGFAPELGEQIAAGVEDGRFERLHAVLLARGGKLVLERYFEGEDQKWGDPIPRAPFGPNRLHDVRSVTKSVVGLLYGIALDEGLTPPLDAPLVE